MKFTEEKLEKAFTELLGQECFSHYFGITIAGKPDAVLSEDPDFWDVWTRKDKEGKEVKRPVDWKSVANDWQEKTE